MIRGFHTPQAPAPSGFVNESVYDAFEVVLKHQGTSLRAGRISSVAACLPGSGPANVPAQCLVDSPKGWCLFWGPLRRESGPGPHPQLHRRGDLWVDPFRSEEACSASSSTRFAGGRVLPYLAVASGPPGRRGIAEQVRLRCPDFVQDLPICADWPLPHGRALFRLAGFFISIPQVVGEKIELRQAFWCPMGLWTGHAFQQHLHRQGGRAGIMVAVWGDHVGGHLDEPA